MAGVGFELNKLFAKNSKFSRFGACFWSSLSCCGSMFLSFILLFFINMLITKYNIPGINSNVFTTYVTNIVLFSMLIYSIFSYVIARYISDLIYENKLEKIMSSFYGVMFIILIFANIVFMPILVASKLSFSFIILLMMLLATLLSTWVIVGYVTILKYYKKICLAFVWGFLLSAVIILLGYFLEILSYELLFLSLILGYGCIFFKLYLLMNKYFKSQNTEAFEILKYFSKYRNLVFTGFFITGGMLVPFYIFWFSDIGNKVSLFFRSAPFYDLPAIIAYLTTIFTTIYFVAFLEPKFYPYYKKYFTLLNNNGSYSELKKTKENMIVTLKRQLQQLITIQAVITLVSAIILSKFLYLMNIGMSQSMLGVYRLLCIGYFLMAIGNSIVLVIIYFADYRSSMKVSAAFFVVTVLVSFISTFLPYYFYGAGIIIGSLVMCLMSINSLENLLDNLEYFVLSEKGLYEKKEKYGFYNFVMKMIKVVTNIFKFKRRVVMYAIVAIVFVIVAASTNMLVDNYAVPVKSADKEVVLVQNASDDILSNPGVGFAPWARSSETINLDTKLVYVDMSWREIEATRGVYDFKSFEERNHLDVYRKQGRNVVFRFYMDYPSDEKKMDIPDWLYEEIEADGTWYNNDYGQGFSPNYSNKVLIKYYTQLVEALGRKYGQDDFFMYIELGAIGHWGEWHVDYDYGIDRLPKYEVRKYYVEPFVNSFRNSYFLMRYPLIEAEKYGFGFYNDMIGHEESTNYWFKMMEGGKWTQTEEYELVDSRNTWKKYPIGGEFTSSLSDDFMLKTNLNNTLEQLKKSHQSFIGPKVIYNMNLYSQYESSLNQILKILGHRLYVSKLELKEDDSVINVSMNINNDGIAPIYTDVDVIVHIYDEHNEILAMNINEYIDINSITSMDTAEFTINNIFEKDKTYKIGISLDDPVSNKPMIELAMENEISDKVYEIGTFIWE